MSEISAMNRRAIRNFAETISKQVSHFSKTEIVSLIHGLIRESGMSGGRLTNPLSAGNGLDKERFSNILYNSFGLTNNFLMYRVFKIFDKDKDGFVSMKEWIEGLSFFLRGTLDEKIKYCFHVYDLNDDNFISREQMIKMIEKCLIRLPAEDDPDEAVKDLVDLTLKKMDHDHDGRLSLADFETAVKEENLLLQAFGTCLPETMVVERFEKLMFQNQLDQW